MSARIFLLPDLGEGLTEALLVNWLVSEGDEVRTDQAIAEVETAKSIVELPTPFAGTVLKLYAAAGDTVDVGAPVIEVGAPGDSPHSPEPPAPDAELGESPALEADSTEIEAHRTEERAGSGSGNVLIGYGTESVATKGRRRRKVAIEEHRTAPAAPPHQAVAVRSPLVRRLAREFGIDVRTIEATGSDGAVTRADVLRSAQQLDGARRSRSASGASPATEAAHGLHGLRVASTERLTPLRRAVSAKLSRSRSEIPEATVWVDVDFTELWALRSRMVPAGAKAPSVTALVARFVLLGLEAYPLLAARLNEDATELSCFDGVNLGIAVDGERGLSVPVLPGADRLSVGELDTALRELSAEARTGRIAPDRLTGSTFTLNNYGGFGVDGSAAIINHPEVAMIGMGRVIERAWVVDGEIAVRRIAQLSLVFDHRVCDGGYAAGFLSTVIELIEHPARAFTRL